MFRDNSSFQQLIGFLAAVILAVVLGVALASPLQLDTIAIVALCFLVLMLPWLLRWHYALLIFAWNASLIVFFLPGQPKLVFMMAFLSLVISVLARPLKKTKRRIHVPSVAYPLAFIGLVALATALLTGGFGASSLGGDSSGGKRYLGVVGAVIGYFVLTSQTIPKRKARLYSLLFFLSGFTAVMSDVAYAAGPNFYFLFNFFPSELAVQQAFTQSSLFRLEGVSVAALSGCYLILMRHGIAGILDWHRPWRGFLFLALMGTSLMGGFRSSLLIIFMIFAVQSVLERVLRRPMFLALVASACLVLIFAISFADKLPLSVQRSISFLPIEKIDSTVKIDAQSTLNWRLEMWKTLLPDVPKYLLLGKGFKYDATDYFLTQKAVASGLYFSSYEEILISGNYHNGWFTIVIPFGIWGLIGFLFFCGAGLRVLYLNYCYGDDSLKKVNTFLLSFFIARLIYYSVFYGQFDLDLVLFVGVVGFSIALNEGVRRKKISEESIENLIPDESVVAAT